MIERIDHVVLTARDVSATLAFYKGLGFDVRQGDGRYELFAGDFKLNVHCYGSELSPHAQTVQPGSGDLCFAISGSLEDFRRQLEQQGVAIELGPVSRTGAHGAMRSLYLRDPDGNLLEFCSYG